VDQHLLAGPDIRGFDQCLPGCQTHQRQACGFGHAEVARQARKVVLIHGDAFGQGADPHVARAGKNRIPRGKARDFRAGGLDHPGQIMAEDQRRLIWQDRLESPVPDLAVELVQRSRVHAHHHVARARFRIGLIRQPQLCALGVFIKDEGFHCKGFPYSAAADSVG
jgi:hypothetical protein